MTSVAADVFEAGDIVWVEFGPPFGHEQAGRRPALVVSPREYNLASSLVLVCPITRNLEAWAFRVEITGPGRIDGAVLVDQVKSIDYLARYVKRAESVSAETLHQVYGVLASLYGIPVAR